MKKSVDYMAQILMDEPNYLEQIKEEPEKTNKVIEEVKKKAEEQARAGIPDTGVYRMVVCFLGIVAVAAIIGSIILVGIKTDVPDALIALGSAAVGALAGLLSPSAKGSE
ncbi:MAG: hypothetical protein WC231_03650 [Dehalococcoidales bacterium]